MYSDLNKINKNLNNQFLDTLSLQELQELQSIINYLLINNSFSLVNTYKKDRETPSMCVMLHYKI